MKIVRFSYKGDDWIAYLIPEGEMSGFIDDDDDIDADSTAAYVEQEKKEIYISEDDLDLDTVLHELLHMARGYQYVDSCNLDFDQAEELFCEMFAEEGEFLIRLGKEIVRCLKKLQKSEEDELKIDIKKDEK